ncbi:DUF4253 domain-containing protein [Saccharibacillus sp. CPCC 101409]|uniref:DUF4253 domain-containing protein n=1 Tax=Saccharibacillus sp. CPCC 101409 TaxID=3058041 RepID=UPI00267185EB|nr:DUF4253 domain-containing protein [Saccharibacillus sp. CPCC 101409]MDO3409392.1 DUF4253 domain-containing protein [Saccharibacillus sp. CPCC 101409]
MNRTITDFLQTYQVEVREVGRVEFPLMFPDGLPRLLILPGDNIQDMMELAADGAASIRSYAEAQAGESAERSGLDALRSIAADRLDRQDSPEDSPGFEEFDLRDLYRAYAGQWEPGIGLLDDRMPAEESSGDDGFDSSAGMPNAEWVERYAQDGLLLLALPASELWNAPLIVPMGGYNDCPQPIEQAILFRDWYERYEAVPIAVTEDTWILQAQILPRTDEEALDLAREHFIFCQYVLESFDSIGQYAAQLKRGGIWEFWWD